MGKQQMTSDFNYLKWGTYLNWAFRQLYIWKDAHNFWYLILL